MKTNKCIFPVVVFALTLAAMLPAPVRAHLMVAQHGTLNFVDGAAFMVISLPLSAFEGIDDDGDGKVSMIEFNNHRAGITHAVRENVVLSQQQVAFPLEGIMLSPVQPHEPGEQSLSQLTVMGKFLVTAVQPELQFQVSLFGKLPEEKRLKITATQQTGSEKLVFELTPTSPSQSLSRIVGVSEA